MVYLALCAMSLVDAERAVQEASLVSQSEDVDKRFAALTLVKQLALTSGYRFVGEAVSDPDLRIAVLAVNSMLLSWKPGFEKDDTFERLESVVDRFPKKAKELDPLVWPWVKLSACATMWGDALLSARGEREPQRLIKYRHLMDSHAREKLAVALGELREFDELARDTMFELLGDTSRDVRAAVIKVLVKIDCKADELERMESLLSRKASDFAPRRTSSTCQAERRTRSWEH